MSALSQPDVTLTPAAAARIGQLIERAPHAVAGVRLSTPKRGCSGLGYSIDYAESADPRDRVVDTGAGLLFLDHRSLEVLHGLVIDWKDEDFDSGFTYLNPNATGSCGCGDSFTV